MARGVRQGCPASGFLFAMAFNPIFRWLHDSIIPRNPVAPDFLQPSPCAYGDDFAVAASFFQTLLTALSRALLPLGPAVPCRPDLPRAGSVCGLGIDLFGIRILSVAARFRTAANSNTLAGGLAKISAAREHDGASHFALTSEWEEKFLKTSMGHSTMEACEGVRHLDHAGRIADSPSSKKQKAATALLRDAIQNRYFSLPIAARASKILGPISRHLWHT